jgi:creatinine amidohydrolase
VHEASCFTGAINFPQRLLLEMLEALLDQIAHNGFEKIVILNGHGGNNAFLDYFAMSQIARQVPYTLYITNARGKHSEAVSHIFETGGGHADEYETSVVMAALPGTVKMEYQTFEEPINPKVDLSHLEGVHTGLWWYAMYPEQVTGCPSKASAEKGQKALDAAILDVAERLCAIKSDTVVPALQREFYRRHSAVRDC